MIKKIVTLSDTSHPFTTYVDDPNGTDKSDIDKLSDQMVDLLFSVKVGEEDDEDDEDDSYRTLTTSEFAAIQAFQVKWGYVGNHDISDDLADMLADTATNFTTLISRVMRKWDLIGPDYSGIRTDLENLFILRDTIMNPTKPTFSADEVKALESLEGEKSDAALRRELFQEESDKRVIRYFIGQTGWAWFVHFIVDMPEVYEGSQPKTFYRAKDGMTTLHMTSLYVSEEKAWDWINEDIRFNTEIDDATLTHVVELDKL